MTIDELKAKVPEQFSPWVEKYGVVFIQMTADELMAWIEMMLKGNQGPAMKIVFDKMNDAEILAAWNTVNEGWQTANEKNVASMELQKAAAMGIAKICLMIALGAVGL